MRRLIMAGVAILTCSPTPGQPLTFDAATIKPFVPQPGRSGGRLFFFGGSRGGPGSSDPGRIQYPVITLKELLTTAYDIKDFQISGPDWLGEERFVIEATMPPETTKEQFHIMLQSLLAERFKMTIHRETRELPMYSMVVGEDGPKMKESPEISNPPPVSAGRGPMKTGPDGFPILPLPSGGRGGLFMIKAPIGARLVGQRQTMQELAERLSSILSKPVTNATALAQKYDFTLTYSTDGPNSEIPDVEPPQNIFAAIQSQLGLKLEPKKGPVDLLVVDHAEKIPTEN